MFPYGSGGLFAVFGKAHTHEYIINLENIQVYKTNVIAVKNGCIAIELAESSIVPNDLSADWAKEHMENTGSEISFF